jgi:hypothetical protein
MEITGWDSVVFTSLGPREVYRFVLASVLRRWPQAIVDDLDDPQAEPLAVETFPDEHLPSERGYLLFLRDAAMTRHMDNSAYMPMSDGDGPFAILARIRQGVEFRCEQLAELRVANEPEFPKVNPYSAWLCSPSLFEITLITPENPELHAFSIWAFETVKQACRGQGSLHEAG